MTNADDSPPSGADEGKERSRSGKPGSTAGAPQNDQSSGGSSPSGSAPFGSDTSEEDDSSSGGFSLPKPSSGGDDSGSGFSLPSPSSLHESSDEPDEADDRSEDDGPEVHQLDTGDLILEEDDHEQGDDEVELLDADDLIIEDDEESGAEQQDFTSGAQLDEDVDEGEFDHAPTMISDGFSSMEDLEGHNEHGESQPGASSGGLNAVAAEMEEAEQRGDLAEPATFDPQDDTVSEADQEEPDKTIVSNTHMAALEEESAPNVSASESGARPLNQNPPTPEQSGRISIDSAANRDPTAEAVQHDDLDPSGDDFNAQKTELFDSPFENDPICPRLTVLDGPSTGQEFLLNNLRNSIGRSTKNSVVLPDEAMSRQHFEVRQNPDDTFTVKDLQSVNGTLLNGTKIREADLFHGDRLKAGQTTMQFVIPGQTTQKDESNRRLVPASSDRSVKAGQRTTSTSTGSQVSGDELTTWLNRIIVGAIALIVPLAGLFAYLTVTRTNSQVTKKQRQRAVAAKEAYLRGVEAVKERDWDQAQQQFQTAQKINAKISGVEAQLKRLKMERKAKQSLKTARDALDEDKTDKAVEAAESIPRESVYYDDARDILRRQRRKQRIASLQERATEQFSEGENQEALATIQRILSIVPNHDDALELRRKVLTRTDVDLDEAKESAQEQDERVARNARPTTGSGSSSADDDLDSSWLIEDDDSSGSSGGSSGSGGSGGGARVVNFTKGFTLYKNKSFGAAISHFEDAASTSGGAVGRRAKKAAGSIKKFRSSYTRANRALSSGNYESAGDHFREALRTDKSVAAAGFFNGEINQKLAEVSARKGMEDFNRGDYASAYKQYDKAKNYASSVSVVRSLKRKLDKKATSIYIKAKAKKKTDPGKTAKLCRRIMSMVPQGSENYRKARRLLDSI